MAAQLLKIPGSIPTDRYSAEFKLPENPRSKKGKRSSIAPSLKSLKAALKESWALKEQIKREF